MKYLIQIVVVYFFIVISSSSKIVERNERNLSFGNILKNYLTKYPAFKEKPLENRQNRRKFPYKIVQPTTLNHQKKAEFHLPKYSENKAKNNKFEQNLYDKNARINRVLSRINFLENKGAASIQNSEYKILQQSPSNHQKTVNSHFSKYSENKLKNKEHAKINFMQNRGAAVNRNFWESSNIPNIFGKFNNNVRSPNFPKSLGNMVRNPDLQSKSKPPVDIPKQWPEVTGNQEINESAWISRSSKPSSPSLLPSMPPTPPPQKKNGGIHHGQDDYKVV